MFGPIKLSCPITRPSKGLHEEQVIMRAGYEDVVHRFVSDEVPTMYQTPQFPAWRPDKVVMECVPESDGHRPIWQCTNTRIIGSEARQKYSSQGQVATQIVEDGIVRTPSDHQGIVADLIYTDQKVYV